MVLQFHEKLIAKPQVKRLYIVCAFAVMYYAVWLPDFKTVFGLHDITISSTAAFGPLNGIVLGPFWGGAVSLGALVSHRLLYHPNDANTFMVLTPLFVMLSSVIAGLIVTKKENIALLIYSILILSWYLFDTGRTAYLQPWFHILALIVFVISYRVVANKAASSTMYTGVYLFLISLIAILSDHMAGSITAIITLDLPSQMFNEYLLIYPVERIILAAGGAFVAFMLIQMEQYVIEDKHIVADEVEKTRMESLQDYLKDVKRVLDEEGEK